MMFISENVPALFKKGTLKLVPSEDGDSLRRVAEAQLVIEPFPHTLARELGEEIASHLYDDDNAIRPELEAIDLRVRAGLQIVTARPDEALEPIAVISPVSIKDVAVSLVEDKKTQRAWLSFSCVLVFSLEDKAVRNFVLDYFGRSLLWTFQSMQRELLDKAAIHEAAARIGEMGGGTLTGPDGDVVEFTPETSKKHRQAANQLRQQAH